MTLQTSKFRLKLHCPYEHENFFLPNEESTAKQRTHNRECTKSAVAYSCKQNTIKFIFLKRQKFSIPRLYIYIRKIDNKLIQVGEVWEAKSTKILLLNKPLQLGLPCYQFFFIYCRITLHYLFLYIYIYIERERERQKIMCIYSAQLNNAQVEEWNREPSWCNG